MARIAIKQITLRDVFSDRVRIHHLDRPEISAGEVCVIQIRGKTVRAVARGHSTRGEMLVDLKTRRSLGIADWQQIPDVSIRKARWWDYCLWGMNASEAVIRISCWLAVISILLGIVGLALGALSVFLAFLLS